MPDHIIKHKVTLSADQRADLERMTRQSSIGVAKKRWATILLLADDAHPDGGRTDEEIAAEVGLSVRQLERVRKRFVRDGMGTTLVRATRSDAGIPKVLDGKAEAHLVTPLRHRPAGRPGPRDPATALRRTGPARGRHPRLPRDGPHLPQKN